MTGTASAHSEGLSLCEASHTKEQDDVTTSALRMTVNNIRLKERKNDPSITAVGRRTTYCYTESAKIQQHGYFGKKIVQEKTHCCLCS